MEKIICNLQNICKTLIIEFEDIANEKMNERLPQPPESIVSKLYLVDDQQKFRNYIFAEYGLHENNSQLLCKML